MTNRYILGTKEFRELEDAEKHVLYKKRCGGSYRVVARDLKVPESTLRGQCKAAAKGREPGRIGRPPALQKEEEDAFIDLIKSKLEAQENISYDMAISIARKMIFDHRGDHLPVPFPSIDRSTIYRLLKKHGLTLTTSRLPVESERFLTIQNNENELPYNNENPPLKKKKQTN
eukprot:scaffold644_cov168-Ochromonas_danica.AAC.6